MNNTTCVVMMVKDEIDILSHVLDHLIEEEIDSFVIADNNSLDGTRDILSDYSKEVENFYIIDDPEVGYYQQQKMTKWISRAVELGAGIIVPVDGDEIWCSIDKEISLSESLKIMKADVAVGYVYDMVPSTNEYVTDNPVTEIVYREPDRELFPCVAFKYVDGCSIAQGNHDVSHPGVRDDLVIEIYHYQYRTFEQYKRKLRNGKAAYDATDLPYGFGEHWRSGGALSDSDLLMQWNNYINQPGLFYAPAPVKIRKK